MRILVISDVHSNLAALDAVLLDAGQWDMTWCLGDVIGYGPQPNECIERLRAMPHVCVVGNHDLASVGRIDTSLFNPDAKAAALWTARQLTARNRAFIEQLPERYAEGDVTLVHGSPRHPVWEYVTSCSIADANWGHFETKYCLVGHSHVPIMYHKGSASRCEETAPDVGRRQSLSPHTIVNPGGVGQPRDADPRASYALLDLPDAVIEFRRVDYDVGRTQELMRKAGLPPRLASRLSIGW